MRVLTVINSLILAGAERLVFDLVPRLEARGVEITLVILKHLDSPLEHELRACGIRFLPVAEGGIYSPAHVLQLARSAADQDLVHVHLFPAQLWTALAARRWPRRLPLVTTEHGASNERRRAWLRPLDRWLYAQYDRVICNSEATARALIAWVPAVAPRTAVVENGVDLTRFTDATERREARARFVLIFVARLESQKDHATVLRALALVPNAELQLVGVGPLEQQLRRLADELGITARVHFLGHRNDVPELLGASDVYVHSSPTEGFGLAVAEAMAAGLPVVATRSDGLEQVLGGAGILVPAGAADQLAQALRRLLDSPEERRRLGALARRQAQNFSIEATADHYVEQYEDVLRQQRNQPAV